LYGTDWTIEAAKALFSRNGCELLEDQYRPSPARMRYRCVCGRISTVRVSDFQAGHRCDDCRREKSRLSPEAAKAYFRENGCELLSEYENYVSPVEFRCACGAISKKSLAAFRLVPFCRENCSQRPATTIELAMELFLKEGCELLEAEYVDAATLMRYRCSCGKESKVSLTKFKCGRRCQECMRIRRLKYKDRGEYELRAKLSLSIRNALIKTLRESGQKKTKRTKDYLGYTASDLRVHLETFPDWNAIRKGGWHVDHIMPIKAFLDYGITDPSLVNCLDNLRPMRARDNHTKSAKYDRLEFERWLEARGVPFTSKL
jgi:hypothetical protein